jgi:putative PIG3 family NAD(P)H quinone oxidoreductase
MLAVVVSEPGGPDKLEFRDLPEPKPQNHELVIEVKATALNRADLLQRRGLYPPPPGESEVLGLECAGVVVARGADAKQFELGARVMALLGGGGYAGRAKVHEGLVLPIPEELSFERAAAIPEAFLTAHEALFGRGELGPGERVLIHAAAGGVGAAACQLASEVGAFAFATTRSADKLAWLSELGVDRAIDTTKEDFAEVVLEETKAHGADVIVDLVGAAFAEKNQKALAGAGRWIVVGLLGGTRGTVDFARLLGLRQMLGGVVMRTRPLTEKAAIVRAFRRDFWPWFAEGRLAPNIDRVYPLAEVRAAHERMEQNLNRGKIVLQVAP